MKKFFWDISGAFGDIGVLFPIAIALIAKNGFNPTALFLAAGLFYIVSAWYFKITMPVQPLKAMSAIAIVSGAGPDVINTAGVAIGVILLLLSFTGLSVRLGHIFPVPVIRGIQLGLGLMLIKSSLNFLAADIPVVMIAGVLLTASIFIFKKIPPLIPILILGIVLSISKINIGRIGPSAFTLSVPDIGNLWTALTLLVLPQIALTFGNAIVAAESTGKTLYGRRAERLNLKSIPLSMGIANILTGIMGGAPMCHGSGGLTAHHKFGATSERSGYIIGAALIILALVFGKSSLSLLAAFPVAILGVLLCYIGVQHSFFIRDILRDKTAMMIALTVAILGFTTSNLTIGFLTGIGIHYGLAGFMKTVRNLKIN
ncbi:MAG: hypothetical protein C4526_05855 [Nitrospiraceae bacterium]|nr:MAG: hypothetical protein C4526_05855 [Nitrospiraceae bacterium]